MSRSAFSYRVFLAPALIAGLMLAALLAVATVAPAAAANNLIFDGLVHSSTGEATLTVPGDGTLRVSNIGSSGQDGVYLQVGGAESVQQSYAPVNLLAPGRRIAWQSQVQTSEGSATLAALARQNGSAVDLFANMSGLGSPSVVVEAHLDETLQGSATTGASGLMARLFSTGEGVQLGLVAVFDGELIFEAPEGTQFGVRLPGGGTVPADFLVIHLPGGQIPTRVQTLVTRPANLDELIIEQEAVEVYDNLLSGLDNTRLIPNSPDGPLVVLNPGGAGTTAGVENDEYRCCWCLTCTLTLAAPDPTVSRVVDISERFLSQNGDRAFYEATVATGGLMEETGTARVDYERSAGSTRVCPQTTGPLFPGGWEFEIRQGENVLFSASGGNGDCATLAPVLSFRQFGHDAVDDLEITMRGYLFGAGVVTGVTRFAPATPGLAVERSMIGATWPNWAITSIQ